MSDWRPVCNPERLDVARVKELWLRGDEARLDAPTIGIVGARTCSAYGRSIARSWARELAGKGWTIVSGLARGIDSEAHRGALEAPVGSQHTIGVLGCGIDRIYPDAHLDLAARLLHAGGAIISEYGPGVPPAPWQFPARNRIIAALSDAILVVEARERSGALITVDFALSYEVPVFAVPGEITSPLSAGTNALIRDHRAEAILALHELADIRV